MVAAGTIFLATQLVLVHRPPSDAVTIGTPLADPWWVGQGGRAELINYHHTGPMQSNALDIMQIGEGGIHRRAAPIWPATTSTTGSSWRRPTVS